MLVEDLYITKKEFKGIKFKTFFNETTVPLFGKKVY